ncbi:MAG TPA: hypothetical protein VIE65_16720 [Methylobacter sp.]
MRQKPMDYHNYTESVCFLKQADGEPHIGTLEAIAFYVKPAKGRKAVGIYNEKERWTTTRIDPDAIIIALKLTIYAIWKNTGLNRRPLR